jgi:hypothetical protein
MLPLSLPAAPGLFRAAARLAGGALAWVLQGRPARAAHGRLAAGGLHRRRAGHAWQLRIVSGRAWVTWAGEPDDCFLSPGDVLLVPAGRELLIGAETALAWVADPVRSGS